MADDTDPTTTPTGNTCGFTLVFGGPDFLPEEFLKDSPLQPSGIAHRGATLSSGNAAEDSWLQFDDLHAGSYPLDAATEALDYLASDREEFQRLAQFPGVIFRTLNFFGDANTCSITLDPEAISLLHELSLAVTVDVYF